MAARNSLTARRLRELLRYDLETGIFTWLVKRGNCPAGSVAGCIDHEGYRVIGIDYASHRAARLAHLYVLGEWPNGEVDHQDRDRANDRWKNLRLASHNQNGCNASNRRPNTTGYRGVVRVKRSRRWLAKVVCGKRQHYFGTHDTERDAALAYDAGARLLHGAFARLNFPAPSALPTEPAQR